MKKKKTHSNETMKPHFKFIYTRKLFQRIEVSIHVSVIYRHAILEVDGVESLPDIPFIVT